MRVERAGERMVDHTDRMGSLGWWEGCTATGGAHVADSSGEAKGHAIGGRIRADIPKDLRCVVGGVGGSPCGTAMEVATPVDGVWRERATLGAARCNRPGTSVEVECAWVYHDLLNCSLERPDQIQ